MSKKIDKIDISILRILQENSNTTLDSIAHNVGVSLNTCWRRIQLLESSGVLERRVALINNEKVGLPLTVFVSIKTDDHSKEWVSQFYSSVANIPEIVEFYRLAGDVDYIIKVMVKCVADYDAVYKRLISKIKLSDVSASFAMEKIKFTTKLPL
jgi:Lrp/AsnC family transcriptional regulator